MLNVTDVDYTIFASIFDNAFDRCNCFQVHFKIAILKNFEKL